MLIIGFRGIIGAGKTTIRRALYERCTNCVNISFADPIKEYLRSIGITKENNLAEYRYLAQTIGALCREADPQFWVNKYIKKICSFSRLIIPELSLNYQLKLAIATDKNNGLLILTDDVRYINEVELLHKYGHIINIVRNDLDTSKEEYQHESEELNLRLQYKAPFDRIHISNNDTVQLAVDIIIKELGLYSYLNPCESLNAKLLEEWKRMIGN